MDSTYDTTGGERPNGDPRDTSQPGYGRRFAEHLRDHHHRHHHVHHHRHGPGWFRADSRFGSGPERGEHRHPEGDHDDRRPGRSDRPWGRGPGRAEFIQAMGRDFGPGGPERGERGPRGGRGRFGPGGPGFGPGPGGPGFGPGGPGFGPGGHGRGRPDRFFERGELRFVILDLINDEPRHGYDVIRALEDQFSGLYSPSPGTVYPTLQLLEDQGFVLSDAQEGKKVYRATDAGREELEKRGDALQAIRDRIGARPVFEAIGDVRPLVGELWELGQTVMRAAGRGDLADAGRVDRLRDAIRRSREEIDAILRDPATPTPPAAKADEGVAADQ